MFTMEYYKYLPPKYSYAMKDLATDFGVFERADVQSMISGSTNLSITTASGFNQGFGFDKGMESYGAGSLKEKDIPLSPIKE